jgi:sulfate permease, SulP family
VSGPTGAMTVALVPIFHQYGASGVLAVGLLAGIVLVVLAVAGVGRAVRYMPAPVIEGFTAGIAVVIALQQFSNALGIAEAEGEKVWQSAFDAVRQYVSQPHHLTLAATDHLAEEHDLLHDHIVADRLDGPLFFAAAHRFLLELTEVSDVHVVILCMYHVTALDTTGALVLGDAISKLEHQGIAVLMSGLRADHRRRLGAIGALPGGRDSSIFEHAPDAIAHARAYLPDPVKVPSP